MNLGPTPFGFWVRGSVEERRELVSARDLFQAYADLDSRIDPNREAYLSAFHFGDDFRDHLKRHDSPKGFDGRCCSPWVWFDLDRIDLNDALFDVRSLVCHLLEYYPSLDEDELLISSGK